MLLACLGERPKELNNSDFVPISYPEPLNDGFEYEIDLVPSLFTNAFFTPFHKPTVFILLRILMKKH
jgi:hypothetical protein